MLIVAIQGLPSSENISTARQTALIIQSNLFQCPGVFVRLLYSHLV